MIYLCATHTNALPFIIITSMRNSIPCGPKPAAYIDRVSYSCFYKLCEKLHNLIPITYSLRIITLHTTINYILTEVAY